MNTKEIKTRHATKCSREEKRKEKFELKYNDELSKALQYNKLIGKEVIFVDTVGVPKLELPLWSVKENIDEIGVVYKKQFKINGVQNLGRFSSVESAINTHKKYIIK